MTQAPSNTPDHEWHKKVAVQCNNRAWELSVRSRSATEDLEMLRAAHTSAYHWAQIGTELNCMRANMLLAEVHALLGHGATALSLASKIRSYFCSRPDTPDWELALTHAIHAHCAHVGRDVAVYRIAYQQAVAALAAVTEEEDRIVVAKTFDQVPRP